MPAEIMYSILDKDMKEICPKCKKHTSRMGIGPGGPECEHGCWDTGPASQEYCGKRMHYAYVTAPSINIELKLREGYNELRIFGDEWADDAYCWKVGDALWLSLILIKDKYEHKGLLHKLLETAKKVHGIKRVIIPTPSSVVALTAIRHFYHLTKLDVELPNGSTEKMDTAVWIKPDY